MDMLQSIDVGLVVLDRDYKVHTWNRFIENHSGISYANALNNSIFKLFPDLPEKWFKNKFESVIALNNRAFTIWEQRPYLFQIKNQRPVTGHAEYMFQNVSLIPLVSVNTEVNHVGLIIYDVTDAACSKRDLEAANNQLQLISRRDALTGINNRGYWSECLELEFNRYKRYKSQVSLIMFDIDNFKNVNDGFGHLAGDEVIKSVAHTLQSSIRSTDISGRYGGDEFGLILPETERDSALYFAERFRKKIEALEVVFEGEVIKYTVSIGVAAMDDNAKTPEDWIQYTDKALYEVKEAGRNLAIAYDPDK